MGSAIAAIIGAHNVTDQVIASCWNETQIEDIQNHTSTTPVQFLGSFVPSPETMDFYFGEAFEHHLNGFSLNFENLYPDFVLRARRRLFSVVAWTVDNVRGAISALPLAGFGL